MTTFIPKELATCKQVLRELKRLDIPTRQSIHSIKLTHDLMATDDYGNHDEPSLLLATFLLAWEELDSITLAVPMDYDYDFWSWELHRPLLTAFARGRWSEVRILYPERIRDPNFFLSHTFYSYVETSVLSVEQHQHLERLRYRQSDDVSTDEDEPDNDQQTGEKPSRISLAAFNAACEQTWAKRGITCQLEEPGPDETGTVIAMRWREPWMREQRQKANPTNILDQNNRLPWQYWTKLYIPPFLEPLPEWNVVLCKTHGNCYSKDTLVRHFICHHGATEDETHDLEFYSEIGDLADTWKDALHPNRQIQPIPGLPIIQGYSCVAPSCHYLTLTLRDLFDHGRDLEHLIDRVEEYSLQTLSSHPAEIRLFKVFSPDDWEFPLGEEDSTKRKRSQEDSGA